MAFEDLEAAVQLWLQDMEHGAEDRHEAYLRLRELLSELRATGMPVPEDLIAFERELEDEFSSDSGNGNEKGGS